MLLAFIAAGIVMAADSLSNAVSNEMNDTAALFGDGGGGGGDNNCGNDGGGGSGGGNTCE